MTTSEIIRTIVVFAGMPVLGWFVAYRWAPSLKAKFMFWFCLVVAIIVLIIACATFELVFLGVITTVSLGGVCFFVVRTLGVNAGVKKFKEEAKNHDKTLQEYAKIKFGDTLLESCELNKYDKAEFKKLLNHYSSVGVITSVDAKVLYYIFFGSSR